MLLCRICATVHVAASTGENRNKAQQARTRLLCPPRSNYAVCSCFREYSHRFINVIQTSMLMHLRNIFNDTDITQQLNYTDVELNQILKQIQALLRKNYGRKLTDDDVEVHMAEAISIMTSTPTHQQHEQPQTSSPEVGAKRKHESYINESFIRGQPTTTGTTSTTPTTATTAE